MRNLSETKKWVRPKNAPLAGVCGAFAKALDANPVVVRLLWLSAGLFFGTGFCIYLVCWWFFPSEEQQYDPDKATFLGVCLRISKKTGVELSIVRIATFLSFFVSVGLTAFAYFISHLLLPKLESTPTSQV